MLGATTLVEWIGQNVAELMPFRVVRPYQRGVRFTRGIYPTTLAPGWHWFVPIYQTIEIVGVAEDSINLPTQTIMTRDGQPLTFSGAILYRISDPVAYWCAVQDAQNSLRDKAMLFLARRLRRRTFAQAVRLQHRTEELLRGELSEKSGRWGIEICDVGLTDFSTARPYRIYNDAPLF